MVFLLILYSISFVSGVALPLWVWVIAWVILLINMFVASMATMAK